MLVRIAAFRARVGGRGLMVAAASFLVFSLGACRESDVTSIRDVVTFLGAASSGSGDAGWSLRSAGEREDVYGSRDEYIELVRASDWSRFSWSVIDEHCDDGVCTVWLHVPDRAAIPEVLRPMLHYSTDGAAPGSNAVVESVTRWPFDSGIVFPYPHAPDG